MTFELHPVLVALILIAAFALGVIVTAVYSRKVRITAVQQAYADAATQHRAQTETTNEARHQPRAALILNPTKDTAGTMGADAAAIFRKEGWAEPLVIETTAEDPGRKMAIEAQRAGVDLVIAAGGDGTVRAVAEVLAGTATPLGIIPLGTGNLLARNLDQHRFRFDQSVRTAIWGRDRPIDVAHLNMDDHEADHVFLVMAGFGFDADIMANTNEELKSRLGWLAYFEAGTRKLGGKPSKVELKLDDQPAEELRVRTVVGGNCGKIQGGIELLPDAKVDDGLLDILTVQAKHLGDWVGVAARFLGRVRTPQVTMEQCREAVVTSEDVLEVQLDGDPIGTASRLHMRVDHHALTVRVATEEQLRAFRQDRFALPVNRAAT